MKNLLSYALLASAVLAVPQPANLVAREDDNNCSMT